MAWYTDSVQLVDDSNWIKIVNGTVRVTNMDSEFIAGGTDEAVLSGKCVLQVNFDPTVDTFAAPKDTVAMRNNGGTVTVYLNTTGTAAGWILFSS